MVKVNTLNTITNIVVEDPQNGISTISATEFFFNVCEGVVSNLLRLVEGHLVEVDGVKYYIAPYFEHDKVAQAYLES
ncbi:hypothetical protein IV286_05945 [Enterococcus faecium]|uniref:hypothetical protein n=1 Tax=Enterococcus faecium TaxID=1352 RepID=UPI001E5C0552|nr:hypothetical protein [Enterococcus faecium]MCD5204536.1 hypothetical protein [Enterococcus faecium]MCD5214678.1 hypothetical protein [Enterococcus faecium]MCD5224819.1 hypothetical protein [Enterococcus faecium]